MNTQIKGYVHDYQQEEYEASLKSTAQVIDNTPVRYHDETYTEYLDRTNPKRYVIANKDNRKTLITHEHILERETNPLE